MKRALQALTLLLVLILVLAGCAGGSGSAADTSSAGADPEEGAGGWQPSGTITLICPFNPGAVGDIFSRSFAEIMSKHAGVTVVVENMGGGSGSIGTTSMISKPADGMTFSYHSNTGALNVAAGNAPFGAEDVLPVANICSDYHIITVPADSPFQTFQDLVDYAQTNPGALKIGGAQVMGNNHLFALLMMRDFTFEGTYVPYDDGASSCLGMLGGNVDCLMSTNSIAWPYVESGDFRCLAYTMADEVAEKKGIPTFASLGSEGLDGYISFKGMFINPDSPDEIKEWYDNMFRQVCADPEWKGFIELQDQVDTYMDMAEFSAYYLAYIQEATELFAGI